VADAIQRNKENKMDIPKMKTNFGSGPRVGNASARPGKRATFAESKAERAGLADEIKRAYDHRNWEELNTKHDPMLEPVHDEVKPVKKFKR
jgi:hypothetical protein